MKKLMAKVILAAIEIVDGQIPEWFVFFEEGWIEIEGEGKALIDRQTYKEMTAYFTRRGNDIVIDYEHQTVEGIKAPAAGWIKGFRYTDGVGIEAQAEWTDEARGYIEKGEYRYFSPVFLVRNSDKRVIAVHSVALTNAPKINHLTPILAKLGEDFREEETNMDFLKKLIAKLGIDAGADEDKVVEAVEAVVAKNKDLEAAKPKEVEIVAKEVLQALDLADGSTKESVISKIEKMKPAVAATDDLARQVGTLSNDIAQRNKADLLDAAVAQGKITAGQVKEWGDDMALKDPDRFKTIMASKTVGSEVPIESLGKKQTKSDDIAIDEAVLNVAKMMGNTEADVKQYGGLQSA